MSKGIKVSPKHGLNPTIPVCFWCGKEKNEIALMGKINKEDSEVPMKAVIDYEPCDCCKQEWAKGTVVVEVTEFPRDKRPPLTRQNNMSYFPTGSLVVITKKAAKEIFNTDNDRIILTSSLFQEIFKNIQNA